MKSTKNGALEYFDFYYAPIFGQEWNKIRIALLTGQKYVALINNYSDFKKETIEELKKKTAFNLFDSIYENLKKNNPLKLEEFKKLKIPAKLKVFSYDIGDTTNFPSPKPDHSGLSSL